MHFEGTVEIAAPRPKVWAFVTDPVSGRLVRPGRGVRRSPSMPTHFKARAKVGIGFINARFVLDGEMVTVTENEVAEVKAHGQAPGSAVDGDGHDAPDATAPTAARRWTGAPTSTSRARWPASARG